MPNIVGPDCVDTVSTDALCVYPATELGGSPTRSPNVRMEGEEVEYYQSTSIPDPTTGQPLPTNVIPLPCQPGDRRVQPTVNTTVFINGNLFAVTGDEAQLVIGGTPRPLVGPYKYPTIRIQEGGATGGSGGNTEGGTTPPDDGGSTPPDEEFPPDDGGSFELY